MMALPHFRGRAVRCAQSCTIVVLAMSLPGGAADAQVSPYQYHYFKEARALSLDVTRIAVWQEGDAATAARDQALVAAGLNPHLAQPWSAPGWTLIQTPEAVNAGEQVEAIVQALAADPAIQFISPVFVDDLGGPMMVTPQLLVGFHENIPPRLAETVLATINPGVVLEADWADMPGAYRIRAHGRNGFEVLDHANALALRPEVAWAEPDMLFTGASTTNDPPFFPNDTFFNQLWGIHNTGQNGGTVDRDMDGPEAWGITTGQSSVRVLIIDTGVQSNHPDLNVILGADFTGENSPQGNPFNQCDNHGTAVAGCVSAIVNNGLGVAGISPNCRSVSARTFISTIPCTGGWSSQASWTVNALTYAENNNVRITNNSNAYGFTSGAIATKYQTTRANGMVHFASAGNDGQASLSYPSSLSTVVAVAALNRNGVRAGFSNFGNGLAISAPGVDIVSTDRTGGAGYVGGDYATVDGTSFASPYTAGVAALVRSANPALSAIQVENILFSTAVDLGPAGYDTGYGWGFVNARNAVTAAQSAACGTGNCYISNGSPGCNNTACCAAVCAKDPFCCYNTWDGICANQAFTICGNCGAPSAGSCFSSNGSPGCNNAACCQTICVADPFCCNTTWDSICANAAIAGCAPPNDACANATVVVSGGVYTWNLTSATNDGESTCGASTTNRDVWYRFTAPVAGTLTATTCGTHDGPGQDQGMDTVLSLHSGCPGTSGNQLACNDDNNLCGSLDQGLLRDSRVTADLAAGQIVRIRVTHFGGAIDDGAFTLRIDFEGAAPINDNCADAISIACGQSINGTTLNATSDPGAGGCGTTISAPGVWYSIIGTGSPITLSTCSAGTNYDTKINVYTNGCGTLTCVAGNDDAGAACPINGLHSEVVFNTTPGQVYLVLVQGFSGQTGNFVLSASCAATQSVYCQCAAQYSAGDQVVLLVNNPSSNPDLVIGSTGTVICGANTSFPDFVLVSWNGLSSGHNGSGFCACPNANGLPPGNTSGWWVRCEDFAPLAPELCPADLNNDGLVNVFDMLSMLTAWGGCPGCAEDFNGDNLVNVFDLLILLGNWGPCPGGCPNDAGCGNYELCGSGGNCICASTYNGGGVCVDGATSCAGLLPCADGNCPPGYYCVINSCCATNVCIPQSALCIDALLAEPPIDPPTPGEPTLGHVVAPSPDEH